MVRIRELDSVSPDRGTDGIESDFDKDKTHVARHIVFVPSEATVPLPVALQFRGDARSVLAVVLVLPAGCKMVKQKNVVLRISQIWYRLEYCKIA